MNTEQARTFLEVAATGNFNRAAARLNVTQSTVSARIRALEDSLGQRLFERDKAGARLTEAGRRFRRHAEALMRTWQQARQEIALPSGFRGVISLGAEPNLWDGLGENLLGWLRRHVPDHALRTQTGSADNLQRKLHEGSIDILLAYEASSRAGFETVHAFDEELILVAHEPRGLVRWHPLYIYVDWGEAVREAHDKAYPVDETPLLTVDQAVLALDYILASGGSGYLPRRIAGPHIAAGRLHRVPDAPIFARSVDAVLRPGLAQTPWFPLWIDEIRRLGFA
jgi:LysR family transcriptional regulator, flagellar master operon regulator